MGYGPTDGDDDLLRFGILDSEIRCDLPCQIEIQCVVVFVDAQGQTHSILIRVQVESGGQGPSLRRIEETMVAEMVIAVGNRDVEGNPTEEFV